MSRSPFLSCVSVCVFIFPVIFWTFGLCGLCLKSGGVKIQKGDFPLDSLVRAQAWCSVGPLTFNWWNRMAWKDFCPCNPHQSVCGFCLLNLNPSLSLLFRYCLSTLLAFLCLDFSRWPALPRLANTITCSIFSVWDSWLRHCVFSQHLMTLMRNTDMCVEKIRMPMC